MSRKRRILLAVLKVAFGLGLLGGLYWTGRLDFSRLADASGLPGTLAAGFALIALVPVLASLRWWVLVRAQGLEFSPGAALRLTLIGFFFNNFLPGATGGDLIKAWYITRRETQRTAAVATIAADRIVGLFSLLTLAAVVLLAHWREAAGSSELFLLLLVAAGGALAAAALGAFFFSTRLRRLRERLILRLAGSGKEGGRGGFREKLGGVLQRADEALYLYRERKTALLLGCLLSVATHLSAVAAISLFAAALGVGDVPFGRYLFLVPLALTVNAIPLSIGGLGQGETAFDYLLETFGPAAKGLGGTLFLLWRLGVLTIGLVGLVLYLLLRAGASGAGAAAADATGAAAADATGAAGGGPEEGEEGTEGQSRRAPESGPGGGGGTGKPPDDSA